MSTTTAPTEFKLGSVERAIAALGALEETPGARLTELSNILKSNAATMLRTLRVLEKHGLVRRSGTGYTLGARLVELGHAAALAVNVVEDLRGGLSDLSRHFNVTAHVGMLRDGMITVIEKLDPPAPLVRYSTLGTRMPLHATAGGKAALALLESLSIPVDLDALDLERYTPATITSSERLHEEISRIREHQFGMEFGEYQVGFSCVGTALRVDGDVYTMSLSGQQVDESVLVERGSELVKVCDSFVRRHSKIAEPIR